MRPIASYLLSALLLFSSIIVPQNAFAQDIPPAQRFTVTPAPYTGVVYDANAPSDGLIMVCGPDHLCGYLDMDGKTAIEYKFSYAGSFVDGLAPASLPYGKLGYIDRTGTFAIDPGFDEAGEFSCGLALVRKGDKTGFIDKTGKFTDIVKNPSHTPVSSFHDGVCWVEDTNGKRAIMDTKGNLLTGFDFVWTGEWSDGVCWASKDMGSDFDHIEMGLVDKTGSFLIAPGIYTDADVFSEGVCWAKRADSDRIYLIDKEGNERIDVPAGRMPSKFLCGVSVNVGGDLLSISNSSGVGIWSSKRYLPVHYGGFSEGAMLVRGQQDETLYIMRDTFYTPIEAQTPVTGYGYEQEQPNQKAFEIALLINDSAALVDGKRTQIDPNDARICAFIQNDRTLLPMRFIAENVPGYTVTWDYLTDSALVQSDYISVLLKADTPAANVLSYSPDVRFYSQAVKTLDQPPVNLYDRLFLPVRALCDMIGVNVYYDPRGLVVVSNTRTSLPYDDASALLAQLTDETN